MSAGTALFPFWYGSMSKGQQEPKPCIIDLKKVAFRVKFGESSLVNYYLNKGVKEKEMNAGLDRARALV